MEIKPTGLDYPTLFLGGFAVTSILLLVVIKLLRDIITELREIRETIHHTTTSDIELRLFGSDDD